MERESRGGEIRPLDELRGAALAPGERDVKGWDVVAADGTRIGEVEAALVDTGSRHIRYLDVAVARHLTPDRGERHVLLPMSAARVAPDEETIVLERLRGEDITNLPRYAHEPITREYELELKDRVENRIGPKAVEEQGFLGPQVDFDPDASK